MLLSGAPRKDLLYGRLDQVWDGWTPTPCPYHMTQRRAVADRQLGAFGATGPCHSMAPFGRGFFDARRYGWSVVGATASSWKVVAVTAVPSVAVDALMMVWLGVSARRTPESASRV